MERSSEFTPSYLDRLIVLLSATMVVLLAGTSASAQEPQWRLRTGVSWLANMGDSAQLNPENTVKLQSPATVLAVDLIRNVDCCVDLFVGAMLPVIGVELSDGTTAQSAGKVTPIAIQAGVTYRTLHRWGELYVSPFVAAYTRDRSQKVSFGGRDMAFTFPGAGAIGVGVGFRRNIGNQESCLRGCNAQFAYDLGIRWQHSTLLIGGDDRISLNPVTFSVSVVTRLR